MGFQIFKEFPLIFFHLIQPMFLIWPVHMIFPYPCNGNMVYILIDYVLHCYNKLSAVWLYESAWLQRRNLSG